ncbi:hypothetical protein F511_11708 [Dorcoceras hygrometricum]|uniref:Uncharacterized protein n=1 Tax=Dorcoceras hygrometricum TaxID=472368 RepID=A0A2Z7A6A1_9LAMI|nr:hypothetical protein F511_11708 [Dorcoceras hygrometricum]
MDQNRPDIGYRPENFMGCPGQARAKPRSKIQPSLQSAGDRRRTEAAATYRARWGADNVARGTRPRAAIDQRARCAQIGASSSHPSAAIGARGSNIWPAAMRGQRACLPRAHMRTAERRGAALRGGAVARVLQNFDFDLKFQD